MYSYSITTITQIKDQNIQKLIFNRNQIVNIFKYKNIILIFNLIVHV